MLNTKYLHFRPVRGKDMVALNPGKRSAFNQDAEASILGWAGAFTCSGGRYHARITGA